MDGIRELMFYLGHWNKSKINRLREVFVVVVNRTPGRVLGHGGMKNEWLKITRITRILHITALSHLFHSYIFFFYCEENKKCPVLMYYVIPKVCSEVKYNVHYKSLPFP